MTALTGPGPSETPRGEGTLRYVLVADADPERSAACLEAIKPFGLGVLVAREGEEAVRIVLRFGAPTLLIADLSLPRPDGFAVIDAVLRTPDAGVPVIAWAPSREVREFAAHRLARLNVRVLDGAAAPLVLRGAIERALQVNGHVERADGQPAAPDDLNEAMSYLSAEAMRLARVAGAAVYLRVPHDPQLRATITWRYDEPAADTLDFLPHVAAWIMRTGNPLVVADARTHEATERLHLPRLGAVHGFAAVPVTGTDGVVIGAICVFDLKPMSLTAADVAKLQALGRGRASAVPSRDVPPPAAVPSPARAAAPFSIERAVNERLVNWPATLMGRRQGLRSIAREWSLATRHGRAFSIVLFRIDRLSPSSATANVFDDEGLAQLAATLTRVMRASDAAIRWNSEELLLLLPGLPEADAHRVAERIRATMQVAAGFGLAVCGAVVELRTDDTPRSLMVRAYQKVQTAREHGHNRVA
jgi:diguanylate cyclase (GGDEF)-like protein